MKDISFNDDDRSEWIDNDPRLYSWWLSSRQSKRKFIRENRAEITAYIRERLKPPPEKTWRDYR